MLKHKPIEMFPKTTYKNGVYRLSTPPERGDILHLRFELQPHSDLANPNLSGSVVPRVPLILAPGDKVRI